MYPDVSSHARHSLPQSEWEPAVKQAKEACPALSLLLSDLCDPCVPYDIADTDTAQTGVSQMSGRGVTQTQTQSQQSRGVASQARSPSGSPSLSPAREQGPSELGLLRSMWAMAGAVRELSSCVGRVGQTPTAAEATKARIASLDSAYNHHYLAATKALHALRTRQQDEAWQDEGERRGGGQRVRQYAPTPDAGSRSEPDCDASLTIDVEECTALVACLTADYKLCRPFPSISAQTLFSPKDLARGTRRWEARGVDAQGYVRKAYSGLCAVPHTSPALTLGLRHYVSLLSCETVVGCLGPASLDRAGTSIADAVTRICSRGVGKGATKGVARGRPGRVGQRERGGAGWERHRQAVLERGRGILQRLCARVGHDLPLNTSRLVINLQPTLSPLSLVIHTRLSALRGVTVESMDSVSAAEEALLSLAVLCGVAPHSWQIRALASQEVRQTLERGCDCLLNATTRAGYKGKVGNRVLGDPRALVQGIVAVAEAEADSSHTTVVPSAQAAIKALTQ
ncbi:LOW QUALITY PROTEIN: hypothetical protein KIPB_010224 [Kipferlia bialata]|uniref:Uncharacterized protein n=1 Tax=Kipferlia bialata TaxID=797122 RepID=A0A9K3D4Y7_9EUKA|nr:LOW QUALITY PROTEIN: hypothetical protein KIPB_010224 [Kipferlia bialata]